MFLLGLGVRGLGSGVLIIAPFGHVVHAGVGVVSLRGALLSPPTFATAAFASFFAQGMAIRCHLPTGSGRTLHLVVVYEFQGASDPEKLAMTGALMGALSHGQPCLIVGDLNTEPNKAACLLHGISAWFWLGSEGLSWGLWGCCWCYLQTLLRIHWRHSEGFLFRGIRCGAL